MADPLPRTLDEPMRSASALDAGLTRSLFLLGDLKRGLRLETIAAYIGRVVELEVRARKVDPMGVPHQASRAPAER